MPQENQVLRCYSCKVFQVHLVKKMKKWQCKICNSKQSVIKVYGTGSGKDCRLHVMKLNELQHLKEQGDDFDSHDVPEYEMEQTSSVNSPPKVEISNTESKWSAFIDDKPKLEESDEEQNFNVYPDIKKKKGFYKKRKRMEKETGGLGKNEKILKVCCKSFEEDICNDLKETSAEVEVQKTSNKCKASYCVSPLKTTSKWSVFVTKKEEEESDENDEKLISYDPAYQKSSYCKSIEFNEGGNRATKMYNSFPIRGKDANWTALEEPKLYKTNAKPEKGKRLSIFQTTDDDDDLSTILSF